MKQTIFQKLKDEGSLERTLEVQNDELFLGSFVSILGNSMIGALLSGSWGSDLPTFMLLSLILGGFNFWICWNVSNHPNRAWRFKRSW